MLKRNLLIAGLILAAGLACVSPAWAIDTSRIKIEPSVDSYGLSRYSIGDYDENGPRLMWEAIPGGDALELAARDYVLLTGDYDISLQEVVDSGLWPYNTFPSGTNFKDRVYGFEWRTVDLWDPVRNAPYGPEIGSDEWWIEARAKILDAFYVSYYFTILDLEHVRTAEIGQRYEAFWLNPLTKAPFVEGEGYGEYWMCPVAWMTRTGAQPDHLTADQLSGIEQIVAALATIPLGPDSAGRYTIDLRLLDPRFSGICTISNTTEDYLRSREFAVSIARSETLSRLWAAGKLDFEFSVPRIRS